MATVGEVHARERRTQPIVTRFVAKHLWSSDSFSSFAEVIGFQRRAYVRATLIVRVYYALSAYWAISVITQWPTYRVLQQAHPLWPTRWWFGWFSVQTSVDIIFCAYLGAALVAMLLPQYRIARALYSFALIEYMGLVNGFDKVNHNLHAWFFVSLVFVLLPAGPWNERRRTSDRQYFLTVIWSAQVVMLLFYTLTGIWKIYFAVRSALHGRPSAFNFSGFSYIVANRLLQSTTKTVLGGYFTRTELLGWALFLGTMYLETSSLLIAFRPRLHRLWGLSLIFFHMGTQLAMGFTFPQNIVLVGLLLVCSPLAPERVHVKAMLLDLPVVHFVSRRVRAFRHHGARQGVLL